MRTCLGDAFEVSWMKNTESVNTNKETLQEQYEVVKKNVRGSQVM